MDAEKVVDWQLASCDHWQLGVLELPTSILVPRPAHVRQNVEAVEKGALSVQMVSRLEGHGWEKNWYGG